MAACLSRILGEEVPDPGGPDPMSFWSGWLGERGLGLVPIASPREFGWAGPWIAILKGRAEEQATIAFGPPSDIIFDPVEDHLPFSAVVRGYLVAPFELGEPEPATKGSKGTVEAIAVAPRKEAPMELVTEAEAIAGRGLVGDRYVDGAGTFSNPYGLGYQLTLMEAERMEAIGRPPELARRNIVTRGIDLNPLVGQAFAVGEVTCIARRLCEPCAHLQRITEPGILRKLVHKGGLRADILEGGRIRVGDEIRPA